MPERNGELRYKDSHVVDTSTENEVHLTPKQIGGIIILVGVITNGGNIYNLASPDDAIDHELLAIQIDRIIDDDKECHRRQEELARDLGILRELVMTYQEVTKYRDDTQERMINEYMRRLQ